MVSWNDIPKEYKPHWSSWKIKGTPLEETQKRLSARGLRDPWLRNEVWKYKVDDKNGNIRKILGRGMKSGFLLFLGVITLEKMLVGSSSGSSSH